MTDLEMTKLCAEAMGYDIEEGALALMVAQKVAEMKADAAPFPIERTIYSWFLYDPLHNDGQCFALVKRFRVDCLADKSGLWLAGINTPCTHSAADADLNRAVVLCVAKMELARKGRT